MKQKHSVYGEFALVLTAVINSFGVVLMHYRARNWNRDCGVYDGTLKSAAQNFYDFVLKQCAGKKIII